ncbi:hypothetical protein [Streptomyces sp. NPDC090798]|uniref:hypothetical protein n=1 Tax=Streptomyces sp. NPDC090798 TaxID=3365968 RepID=UPI00380C488E
MAATVEAGTVNAYRTAAADAVAVDALARADASTLTIFGTGHQALYECAAVSKVRPIDTIHVARSAERGERFLALGDVLTGKAEGRRTPEDITVFDSSGIALQDLRVATALLNAVPKAPGSYADSNG